MNSLIPQYDGWNVYLVQWNWYWNSAFYSGVFYFQFPIDCQ